MEKFIPCRRCHKPPLPDGYFYELKNNQKVIKECPHHIEWSKKNELFKKFKKSGFQEDLFDYDISSYMGDKSSKNIQRLQKYVSLIDDSKVRSSILYLYGNPGTQKTTVSNFLGKNILQKYKCNYILMSNLILNLHKSNIDQEIKDKIDILSESDVIIIDESFTQRSQWGGYLENFLKERINNQKGIIFISNIAPMTISTNGYPKSIQNLVERELLKRDSLFVFEDSYADNLGKIPEVLF
jgi:DNA replication protein DnaC